MGKKLSAPHSQQDLWKSFQPARCIYNLQFDLLGRLSADVCPDITGQFGCGHRAKFRLSVGGLEGKWVWPRGEIHPFGGGGGGKEVFHKEHIPAILDINCLTHPELSFAQQHFPSKDIFQPAKICLKNRYFEETNPLGAPACHTGRPTTSFKVTLRESGSLHWGLLWLPTPPNKGDSIAPLHTRNKVPEKLVL